MSEKTFKTINMLKSLHNEGMKSIMILDGAGRTETLYEAHISAEIGDPCLFTKYKYVDGAGGSDQTVIAYEESIVSWPGYELLDVGAGNDIDNLS